MPPPSLDRRRFLAHATAGAGALVAGLAGCDPDRTAHAPLRPDKSDRDTIPLPDPIPYPANRPNVILVRFGGGVRRRETVQVPERTYCPFIRHELAGKHGVLFSNVEIAS